MRKRNLFFTIFAIIALVVVFALPQAEALKKEKPPTQILITNVNVWDGTIEKVEAIDVLVEGNKIKRIGKINAPNAVKIDGQGGTLTPGFIDTHTHIALVAPFDQLENEYDGVYVGAVAAQMAENMLMRGFTSVRDAGGASIGIMRAINEGRLIGPRIFSSGAFLTQTSGHLDMHDHTHNRSQREHNQGYQPQLHTAQLGQFAQVERRRPNIQQDGDPN